MARILIVDDDLDLTESVEDWLVYEGHSLTVANNGTTGWNFLTSGEFDLAILDWDMADLSGIDIVKQYRSDNGSTPIILLTGRGSVDDKEIGLDAGAHDYLTKPFHMKELSARVRATLRAHAKTFVPLGSGNEEVLKEGALEGTSLAARYEFIEIIGEGGAGIVFKARHPKMDKFVAVKMIKSSKHTPEMISRFESEARLASKLRHPSIIIVHDFGVTEKRNPFMVMEHVEGKSLDTEIRQRDFLPVEEALPLLCQIADGLSHAHRSGVLHRDLKPTNIMLRQTADQLPLPIILDFGLAKLTENQPGGDKQITVDRQIIGTPAYISPEQIRASQVDERSDLYSLGCLAFEMLTGYPPFMAENPIEQILKRLDEEPFSFREIRPDLDFPQGLEALIGKLLQREPSLRHQSASELLDELKQLMSQVK